VPNKRSVNDTKQSIKPYEEEESYENPVNLSKMPGIVEDYIDIRSDYVPGYLHVNNSIGPSKGFVNIDHIDLDESDIQINEYNDRRAGGSEETVKIQKQAKKADAKKVEIKNPLPD